MNQRSDLRDGKTILPDATDAARRMSAADLAQWGVNVVAYVRRIENPTNDAAFAIYAANGEPIGVAGSREVADVGLRQNDLELVNVH